MSKADLNILENAIRSTEDIIFFDEKVFFDDKISIEDKVMRDYVELEYLQNSNKTANFVNSSLFYLQKRFYYFFKKKRPSFSIVVKGYKTDIVENSEATIYVNCIVGIKNFQHAVPYFATVLFIKRDGKISAGIVNNYAENQMFNCVKGGGCFMNTNRTRVSNRNSLNNSLIAVKYGKQKQDIEKITSKLPFFNINNCSVLDFCNTANGKYDGCIILDGTKEELEIGELFVQESGGLVHYLNDEKTSCIFSNSLILNELKKIF